MEHKYRKTIIWILSFAMAFSMIPQLAFAAEEESDISSEVIATETDEQNEENAELQQEQSNDCNLDGENLEKGENKLNSLSEAPKQSDSVRKTKSTNAVSNDTVSIEWLINNGPKTGVVGTVLSDNVKMTGMNSEDIEFQSDNQEALPDNCIWAGEDGRIYFLGVSAGSANVRMVHKNNPDISSSIKTFNIRQLKTPTKDLLIGGSVSVVLHKTIPFECKYEIEDPTIATVDEQGIVTGRNIGSTTLHITSKEVPTLDCKRTINVKEDPTGIYYNDKKVTSLQWDQKTQGTELSLKVLNVNGIDRTAEVVYYSSNTDVAEPIYKSGSGMAEQHSGTGKINIKKNGTAVIYVYESVQRKPLIGTLTLNVTGCDEDSDPDGGWETLTEAQGLNSNVQLMDTSVETNTFNDFFYENRITNYLYVNQLSFSLKLINPNAKLDSPQYSEEVLNVYKEALLAKVKICRQDKDGNEGEVVADYNQGYTLENFSHELEGRAWAAVFKLRVDPTVLHKGESYILTIDGKATAYIERDGSLDEHNGIITPALWHFTTIAAAKTIDLDQTSATLDPGQSLKLTAELNKNEKVAADDTVSWTSSDSEVASVDENGNVTANKAGKAVITATAVDGKVSATCEITIKGEDKPVVDPSDPTDKPVVDPSDPTDEPVVDPSDPTDEPVVDPSEPTDEQVIDSSDPADDRKTPSKGDGSHKASAGQTADKSAETGDEMNIGFYLAWMLAAACAGAVVVATGRACRRKQ